MGWVRKLRISFFRGPVRPRPTQSLVQLESSNKSAGMVIHLARPPQESEKGSDPPVFVSLFEPENIFRNLSLGVIPTGKVLSVQETIEKKGPSRNKVFPTIPSDGFSHRLKCIEELSFITFPGLLRTRRDTKYVNTVSYTSSIKLGTIDIPNSIQARPIASTT